MQELKRAQSGWLGVRLRDWLGATRDEFDIVLAVTSTEHPSVAFTAA